MDWMTFVVGVLKAIAWPTTLLLLTFWLRKPLRDLVPLLRKLKVKEFELEFAQAIAQLEVEAQPGGSQPVSTPSPDSKDADRHQESKVSVPNGAIAGGGKLSREEQVLRLAPLSPRAAIMEAWAEVEAAAVEKAAALWGPGNRPEVFRTMARLGEYLLQSKVIDAGQLATFNRLRELRNKAVHAEELNLGVEETRKYVALALTLAKDIGSA